MVRFNPRRHIDMLAAEVTRALASRRDAVLPSDQALDQVARMTQSDVEDALSLFREANEGHETARLLDGPAGRANVPEISAPLAFILGVLALPAFVVLVIGVELTGEALHLSEKATDLVRTVCCALIAHPLTYVVAGWWLS